MKQNVQVIGVYLYLANFRLNLLNSNYDVSRDLRRV